MRRGVLDIDNEVASRISGRGVEGVAESKGYDELDELINGVVIGKIKEMVKK